MKKLKERIGEVYETDMGDFKRRVVSYLNNFLEEELSAPVKLNIKGIKKFVVCYITPENNPMEEIDQLRLLILNKLDQVEISPAAM